MGNLLLTFMALLLRFIDLADLPVAFHGDEGEFGLLARIILTGSKKVPLFGTAWLSMPNISFYFRAVSREIFGYSVFGFFPTVSPIHHRRYRNSI